MFEKLKTYRNGVEFLDFKSIPLNSDCHLLTDKDSHKIDEYWSSRIDGTFDYEDETFIHSMVEYYPCYFTSFNERDEIYIEIFIGTTHAFVKTGTWLKKDEISEIFQITCSGEEVTIIIKDSVLNNIKNNCKLSISNINWLK